ncbi:MAG: GWxTD domain-containing protein [Acidobacteriota bacterium]
MRCSPVLVASLLMIGVLQGCATGSTGAEGDRLVNPTLGPDYSQWLIGPIARMATAAELDAFAALRSDTEAAAFVEEFWKQRDPKPLRPDNPLRETFAERADEADSRYSEAGVRGRRTARGTIYILFGEPDDTDYEIPIDHRDPPVEVWTYEGQREAGLDNSRPAELYRFIKRGEVTEFYIPRTRLDERRGSGIEIDRY